MTGDESQVTQLLRLWGEGDAGALDQLIPIVYDRLHQMAHERIRYEKGEHTLNTTGLVHEAYVRLVEASDHSFRDRSHFLAVASRVMRSLLVDRARARKAGKRGGGFATVPLRDDLWMSDSQADSVAELSDALQRLEALDPRQAQILEQRYFGGLSLEETAAALDISVATVKRQLRSARAWLAAELGAVPTI
jgi:RNA polymerase sigma factor (TIGR02999 family)